MLGTDRSPEFIEGGARQDAKPACTALVPLAEPARWLNRLPRRALPDPIFVTQLIATAEQFPQTRSLRRAEMTDALSAYRPAAAGQRVGSRTRQSI
jgi:hypothetical protein